MFSVSDWLDRAKAGAQAESDYRLAKILGITHSAVSAYRTGVRFPDDPTIMKLCRLSHDDPEYVAACLQSMRAANDESARLWRRVAKRLAGNANVVMLAAAAAFFVALGCASDDAAAEVLSAPRAVSLYIMLSVAGRIGWRLWRARASLRHLNSPHAPAP